MGRKGAGAAAGDAVSMAAAGEASDDEEEPTEERYTDPWAEEDEPHDPAADASGAGAARWLLHVARAIHTAYSHSGTPPPAAIHISKLPGAVPTISISHNTLRVRYSTRNNIPRQHLLAAKPYSPPESTSVPCAEDARGTCNWHYWPGWFLSC